MNDKLKLNWDNEQSEKEREGNWYEPRIYKQEVININRTREIEREKEESEEEERGNINTDIDW